MSKSPRAPAPLAINLQRLRKQAGLTQSELGKAVRVKQSAVSNWETGKTKLKVVDLPKVAAALHASLDQLFHGLWPPYDASRAAPDPRVASHPSVQNVAWHAHAILALVGTPAVPVGATPAVSIGETPRRRRRRSPAAPS